MLSKGKNLGHEKLTEPWLGPLECLTEKTFVSLRLFSAAHPSFSSKRYFFSTWHKDNYEPLIDIQSFFAETHSCSPLVLEWTEISTSGPLESRDTFTARLNSCNTRLGRWAPSDCGSMHCSWRLWDALTAYRAVTCFLRNIEIEPKACLLPVVHY